LIYYIKILQPRRGTTEWIIAEVNRPDLTFINYRYPLSRKDILPLLIITLAFMALAVLNLGDTNDVDVIMDINSPAEVRNHLDNMYFDEVYFVRTAVEHIKNLNPYETTHPPLGKLLIAASILVFGENPFGWRLFGAIFGVLMLPVMYIFIKNMFGRTFIAVCGTLLLGFDFMRFVQTRIGTIDTFLVLFILLAFFFMYRHITTNPDLPFRKSLLPLALSGFFFGLSCAVKWTGFYAGLGLMIIYIIRLIDLGMYYKDVKKSGFGVYLTKTLLFSVLFFVIIPAISYYLTYIPYGTLRGMTISDGMLWSADYFRIVRENQEWVFRYHSTLVAEHHYSSTWWQWILNIRPILYVRNTADGMRAIFGAFGNPIIWWGGFAAMIIMLVRVFTHRDGKALFILLGYLSQLLPWVAVSRIVFIYHYFPCTLFIVLALVHMFNTIREQRRCCDKAVIYGYTATSGILFGMFYPSLSGMYMPDWYYRVIVKWFITWPF